MSSQGVITKIGYRICDWNGNTIIEPLQHPHASIWNIQAMQRGAPGSLAVGNFTIPLFPPRSREYAQYKGEYSLIRYGCRVEGYVLGESGEYQSGTPVFSGIITKINKELDKFELQGFDSLWLAQQSQFYPGQSYVGNGGNLIDSFNDVESLIFADDFAGNNYSQVIGNTPSWANVSGSGPQWIPVTDEGLSGWRAPIASVNTQEGILLNNQAALPDLFNNWASNQMGPTNSYVISAWFHLAGISVVANDIAGAELVIGSDAAALNLYLCQAICVGNGTTYDVRARIWKRVAGTYTMLADTSVFTGLSGDFRAQLTAIMLGDATDNKIRLLVNGKDTNCVALHSGAIGAYGERSGARVVNLTSGSSTSFISKFYSKLRMQIPVSGVPMIQALTPFTDTGGPSGSFPMNLSLNGLTLLDLWSLAATAENFVWRKDCKRSIPVNPNQVFLDIGEPVSWGPQGFFNIATLGSAGTGNDLSQSIILNEEVEIVSGGAFANAESMGTELKLGFSPSNNSGGQLVWPDIAGMLALGSSPLPQTIANAPPLIFTDTINATGLTDFATARRMAENTGANKAIINAGAKKFTILRTPDIAIPRLDIFSLQLYDSDYAGNAFVGASPQAFRELDFITINVPSLDIFMQKVSVVAYTFRESDPTFDVVLDQFSFHEKQLTGRRMSNNIDTGFLTFAPR